MKYEARVYFSKAAGKSGLGICDVRNDSGWLWRLCNMCNMVRWIQFFFLLLGASLPFHPPSGTFPDCQVSLNASHDRWLERQPLCFASLHSHPCTLVGGPECLGLCLLTPWILESYLYPVTTSYPLSYPHSLSKEIIPIK